MVKFPMTESYERTRKFLERYLTAIIFLSGMMLVFLFALAVILIDRFA